MFKSTIAVLTLISSFSAFSFECTAINRYFEKGEYHEEKSALMTTLENSSVLKMEVELNGEQFFITYNKNDEDALIQIVNAKDDTKGIVARSAFSKYGSMSLTTVDGQTVYRMECFK